MAAQARHIATSAKANSLASALNPTLDNGCFCHRCHLSLFGQMRKCKQFFSAPVDHVSNAVQAAIKVYPCCTAVLALPHHSITDRDLSNNPATVCHVQAAGSRRCPSEGEHTAQTGATSSQVSSPAAVFPHALALCQLQQVKQAVAQARLPPPEPRPARLYIPFPDCGDKPSKHDSNPSAVCLLRRLHKFPLTRDVQSKSSLPSPWIRGSRAHEPIAHTCIEKRRNR